jgi:hypothetical protein
LAASPHFGLQAGNDGLQQRNVAGAAGRTRVVMSLQLGIKRDDAGAVVTTDAADKAIDMRAQGAPVAVLDAAE